MKEKERGRERCSEGKRKRERDAVKEKERGRERCSEGKRERGRDAK